MTPENKNHEIARHIASQLDLGIEAKKEHVKAIKEALDAKDTEMKSYKDFFDLASKGCQTCAESAKEIASLNEKLDAMKYLQEIAKKSFEIQSSNLTILQEALEKIKSIQEKSSDEYEIIVIWQIAKEALSEIKKVSGG